MAFSKEVVRMFFDQHGPTLLADGGGKKGTLIFTGTLGAMGQCQLCGIWSFAVRGTVFDSSLS